MWGTESCIQVYELKGVKGLVNKLVCCNHVVSSSLALSPAHLSDQICPTYVSMFTCAYTITLQVSDQSVITQNLILTFCNIIQLLARQARHHIVNMGWTVSSRQKLVHSTYFCIATTLLLAFCCSPTNGVDDDLTSFCIPENSTLAQTANCRCHRGGRGGMDGRTCGQSAELVDLVCSGVSAVDLPVGEFYDHITCL